MEKTTKPKPENVAPPREAGGRLPESDVTSESAIPNDQVQDAKVIGYTVQEHVRTVPEGPEQGQMKDAHYRCSCCGGVILPEHQMVTMGTLSSKHDRFHATCAFGGYADVPWRYRNFGMPDIPATTQTVPVPSPQLVSQVDSTTQGPWSSVTLTKNSKGYTHEIKLYFPPETTPDELEKRGEKFLKVIEKLESIGSEGRHDFNE